MINIISIFLILIVLYLLYESRFSEHFSSYKRCNEKPLRGIMKKIFEKYKINKTQKDDYDVYIPCGYNRVEQELKTINPEKYQKIYGVSGCDKIVSKNNLWTLLFDKYGREEASKIMPESFILEDSNDMKDFYKKHKKNNAYILKKNLQRKLGIKITRNLKTIEKAKNERFRVVQKYIDAFIINKRKMNLRIYMLVICQENNKKVYFHKLGKCLYTSKDITSNDSLDFDENITNSYKVDKKIYQNNPMTIDSLYDYLNKNNYDASLLEKNLKNLLKKIVPIVKEPLCNLKSIKKNVKFQLFGLDVIFDNNLNTYLLEVNKGPDMGPKDDDDEKLKTKIQVDTYEKAGIINVDDKNYQNGYLEY